MLDVDSLRNVIATKTSVKREVHNAHWEHSPLQRMFFCLLYLSTPVPSRLFPLLGPRVLLLRNKRAAAATTTKQPDPFVWKNNLVHSLYEIQQRKSFSHKIIYLLNIRPEHLSINRNHLRGPPGDPPSLPPGTLARIKKLTPSFRRLFHTWRTCALESSERPKRWSRTCSRRWLLSSMAFGTV